eukprot:GDKI01017563.1.p1 GENE.GDKI01017563.1~~GDKI01017563.1.p1  ORF type:complete len:343 (-),score=84.63 GDKI01017563.1:160-1188(-)
MAINPILAMDQNTRQLFPMAEPGELFILRRDGIDFQAKLPTGTMKGSGEFFLTSKRIVFLKKGDPSTHKEFTSFELPLRHMQNPKFQQPIFGANYLEGKIAPNMEAGNPITGTATFYLTFNKGGCGTFLPMFFRLMGDIERAHAPNPQFMQQVSSGHLNNIAYVDPNDPSVLYISQPTPAPGGNITPAGPNNPPPGGWGVPQAIGPNTYQPPTYTPPTQPNPYAQPQQQNAPNPYAQQNAQNPYAQQQQQGGNPYAQGGSGGGNPYSQNAANPYAQQNAPNPYAQQGGNAPNPYEQGTPNPFQNAPMNAPQYSTQQQPPYTQQGGNPYAPSAPPATNPNWNR